MQEQKTGLAVQGGIDMDIGDVMRDMMRREQQEKLERYRMLNRNVKKGQILFTGSSLMEQFPINELLMTNGMNVIIYNRGIGGFTTVDMLEHMEEMARFLAEKRIVVPEKMRDFCRLGFAYSEELSNDNKYVFVAV